MEELYITKFNTINGDSFEELSIDKFMNILSTNNYELVADDYLDFEIKYETEVYKDTNGYIIIYGGNDYHINTNNYPYLTKQLEKLSVITKNRINERNNYDNLRSDKVNNYHEYVGGLNYLKKVNRSAKRIVILSLVKLIASIIGSLAIFPWFMTFTNYLHNPAFFDTPLGFILGMIASIVLSAVSLATLSTYGHQYIKIIKDYGKMHRLIKGKIRKLKRMLSRVSNTNIETHTRIVDNDDIYKDSIINYMNSIMKAANKLNKEDRKTKLLELRNILDEYTKKCQKLNTNDNKGLTLDGGKRQIMMETIEKLTTLEMEIADMLHRDSKNEVLFAEKEKFMMELDDNLKEAEHKNEAIAYGLGAGYIGGFDNSSCKTLSR